jgi:hypothetical protein
MLSRFAVTRQWICVQRDGVIVLDWGDGRAIDLIRGEFIPYNPSQFSHPVQNDELETLKRMGRISSYDQTNVYIISLPEAPLRKSE